MPGLLGPTTPVPGYETNAVKVPTQAPPLTDTSIQNVVDPNRVTRPDQRSDQRDAGDSAGGTNRYESNFMTFLQRLRGAQNLSHTFLRTMIGQGMEVSSGIRTGFAEEMARFLDFLRMDEGELLNFLKNQLQSSTRFRGALFDMLREAYRGTQSDLVKTDILQFLRRYSDFTSTEHLEEKLSRSMEDMTRSLPSPWSGQLSELLAKLENGMESGDREGNLQLLREQLFPLIARYVSITHDHGQARMLLSMMTLDVARYENGGEKGLIQAFRHLASNGVLPRELATLTDEEVLRLLQDGEFAKVSRSNTFADQLSSLTHRALQGQAGAEAQEAFRSILSSMLINESVYMPLNHVILPLNWNGDMVFSEMWLDPDAEQKNGGPGAQSGERTMRLLIKMDISSLGAFDLLFNGTAESISLQVACPRSVSQYAGQMSSVLREILTRNGLNAAEVQVAEMKRPLTVSEVFPKLYERMSGVNVKV